MKIGTKLSLGFGTIVLLILTLSVFSFFQTKQIEGLIKKQNQERTEKLERLYIAREALDQTGLAARNAFIFTSDEDAKKELDILDRQKAIYLDALNSLTPLFAGDSNFDKVRRGLLTMSEELKRPREFREANNMQEFGEFLVKDCSPLRRQIVSDIERVLVNTQENVNVQSKNVEHSVEQSEIVVLVVAIGALVLSAVIGTVLTKGLLAQLGGEPSDVSAIARSIADGDLTPHVEVKPHDQSSVMHAMREMRNSLVQIVGRVRSDTDTIGTVSRQLAAGNIDLSSRTEEQGASLQATATSMEELTSTVRQNADNARQANELAEAASGVAIKGGEVVSAVVKTMGSINESARKISDIISVIDGIAFQTNILALNAAVEAARAGEQGRGFAVVASEVRTLAQRSAAAAKEIKDLINDSVEKVDAGSKPVNQAGNTMIDIVNSVKSVTDIMAEIMSASQEQSVGIEQVNQAIVQMDAVTQQNATLVEEAAAAAESLQNQAGDLAGVVSLFKLDSSHLPR